MYENRKRKVIIVGGGLVGSLCACFMAKRGYKVTLYEKRDGCVTIVGLSPTGTLKGGSDSTIKCGCPSSNYVTSGVTDFLDIRTRKTMPGRSINLALSHRGRKALRMVGLELEILRAAIPMKGRHLHNKSGEPTSVPYDPVTNECIYSVGRNLLNKALLQAAEKYPNVNLHFNQKLVRSSFDEGSITLLNTKTYETYEDKADLIIGADGAFSALRSFMQHTPLFQFSQKYIEHGYLELSVPPERGSQMAPNYLHIWPRGEFMMIALPNQDSSWTVTLFMPFERFDKLTSRENILKFFKETFPDSVNLIGEEELVQTILENKPSNLVSVKCRPFHAGSKFLIIGDAAHAMVPFYGQGMNAGFEDCSLLDELLEKYDDNIAEIIRKFSEIRTENAEAICDLAMYNYEEMRNLVTKSSYHMRRAIDNILFRMLNDKWVPLYNSISFSHIDYLECLENRKWQDRVIKTALMGTTITGLFISYYTYVNFI